MSCADFNLTAARENTYFIFKFYQETAILFIPSANKINLLIFILYYFYYTYLPTYITIPTYIIIVAGSPWEWISSLNEKGLITHHSFEMQLADFTDFKNTMEKSGVQISPRYFTTPFGSLQVASSKFQIII